MPLTTSTWNGSNANWATAVDWSAGEPDTAAPALAAVLAGSGNYTVTVNTNIGTIATSGATASSVGLLISDVSARLSIGVGGTLVVGAANGNGGLATITGADLVVSGGTFVTTSTLTISSDRFFAESGGFAQVAAFSESNASIFIESGGTLAILGALSQTSNAGLAFTSPGLLTLGDVSGAATVDLNFLGVAAPDARVFWTNAAAADLAHLTLLDFGATNTLDVATSGAATITGTVLSANALTIDTTGGNIVVGLGSGAAAQYFATTTALGAQNIVRITAGLTTSNWLSANGDGNWTAATDWDDAVPPGGSAANYAAVLGGSGSYTVAVNSNIGTIAAAAAVASTVGLAVSDNFGVLAIQAGGTLAVGAANGNGGLVSTAGEIAVQAGGSFSATNTVSVSRSGLLSITGVATVAALSGAGAIAAIISVGGTLAITGALGGTGGIEDGSNCLLTLGDASGAQTIDLTPAVGPSSDARVYWTNSATTADLANLKLLDFSGTNTLDVATSGAVTITGTVLSANALTIDTTGGNIVVGLGSGASTQYLAATTTIGSQNVVEITACFLRGTAIATPDGAVAVESLRIGDDVVTRFGRRPVQWIGWREIDCAKHPRPRDVWPVRIDPGAFGPGQPSRTLRLSPDHAVFVDDVLIPVRLLLNGATIVQEKATSVSYWHVELPAHDILFAEGLACESYLDTGNRSAFANGGGATMLHPDFSLRVWEAEACAELVRDGAELEAARSWLLERASMLGHGLTCVPNVRLLAGRREIAADGWGLSAVVPRGTRNVRLLSHRFVPTHVRPESDDTRVLGIAVTRVCLDDAEIALDDPRLDAGWHAPEAEWRWSDGAAGISVGTARRLRVEWANAGLYWDVPEQRQGRHPIGTARGRSPASASKKTICRHWGCDDARTRSL